MGNSQTIIEPKQDACDIHELLSLPNDVFCRILDFLTLGDTTHLITCSHVFMQKLGNSTFWKTLLAEDWGTVKHSLPTNPALILYRTLLCNEFVKKFNRTQLGKKISQQAPAFTQFDSTRFIAGPDQKIPSTYKTEDELVGPG